ncbi:hypothetical protein D9615_002344 [Tricholomella constricta]|uniref:Uncharacterized protein n=1 Tax=Tricholomella constricta TaxID=117010 RepID=A0A8H5HMR0_9AGAR|nr:hypothetical protein D9615_002344 [Tricholomella constricta]
MIRRAKKRRQKAATDEELGFGQHLNTQPDLAQLPKTYDGIQVLRSPPTQPVDEPKISGNIRKPIPLPLLTVSSPEELISKPRRVPVPRLPPISSSPRVIGIPPSPRLVGLPPSPQPPTSPRTPRPSLKSQDLSEPVRSSPRGLHSPLTPAIDGGHALEVPLSAGGLERMITRMEKELREDT